MSTRRTPAQGGLWGRQQPLPTTRPGKRTAVNDLDLVASVVRSAQDPGYVLIGPAERVFLRDPARGKRFVVSVPRYEADAVAQLLDADHLKVGGTHQVTDGRRDGPARSVLVPAATRSMVARWDALHRLPATTHVPARITPASHVPTGTQSGPPLSAVDGAATHPGGGLRPRGAWRALWCPECGEPAQPRPPTRWIDTHGPRPGHSHLDGEPLCPVVTASGYRPAWPTTRHPGDPADPGHRGDRR